MVMFSHTTLGPTGCRTSSPTNFVIPNIPTQERLAKPYAGTLPMPLPAAKLIRSAFGGSIPAT